MPRGCLASPSRTHLQGRGCTPPRRRACRCAIAEHIGAKLGVPVVAKTGDEVQAHFGSFDVALASAAAS